MPKSTIFDGRLLTFLAADDEDVPRLEIAVNDPDGVRRRERARELPPDGAQRGPVAREGAAAREPMRQVLARQILHDDERPPAAVQIAVEDLDDAGVPHGGRRARLGEEAAHDVRLLGQLGAQHLDGGVTAHVPVPRLIDLTHRPRAQRPDDCAGA